MPTRYGTADFGRKPCGCRKHPGMSFPGCCLFVLLCIGMKCLYHKCNKEFVPRRKDQVYCRSKCCDRASSNRTGAALRHSRRRNWKSRGIKITDVQYEQMVRGQASMCMICQSQISSLCVDHDHITGKIRGLLCSHCNMGLGNFSDNPIFLRSAIKYLTERKSFPDPSDLPSCT